MITSRRSRRLWRWSATLFAGVLIAAVAGAPTATAQAAKLAQGVRSARIERALLTDKIEPRLSSARGQVTAFVELTRTPAVDAFNGERRKGTGKEKAKQAVREVRDGTVRAVDSVVRQLKAADAGARLITQTANAVPGAVVTADAATLRDLAKRSDVVSMRTVVPMRRTNAGAVQLTRTLNTWQQTGKFGDGVRVGVVDDGIDYTHADFGGPGTPQAYQETDRTKPSPLFPSAKVIGGVDLVGDDYDASGTTGGSLVPEPDSNPLPCSTHGTHVAGTAAGFGVNADGSTFTGDYAKLTADELNAMKIGPGTAPKALLYAIKVFGCDGSSAVVPQALDLALDPDGDGDFSDRLDVLNLSLGEDFGMADDPNSLFVRKLAENNVLTVVSAGNSGDVNDAGGTPANVVEALAVGSTLDAAIKTDVIDMTAPVPGRLTGQFSKAYTHFGTLDLTAPAAALSQANNDGCAPYSAADSAKAAGNIVWLEWDDNDATRACGTAVRAGHAQNAGAKGVILASTLERFRAAITGNQDVPMFQLRGSATAAARPALIAGSLRLRMAGTGIESGLSYYQPDADTASGFTSRGGRRPAVKPDLAAPGDTIVSALRGSGTGWGEFSGTSMAAPHTTGIAALVRQIHPDWSVEEVKAALMGTAGHDVHDSSGRTFGPQRVGSGRIDAQAAVDNLVLPYVTDDPGAVSVNFGVVEVSGPLAVTKTLKIVNKGAAPAEYAVGYEAVHTLPGVEYTVNKKSLALTPRGVANVEVTLKITDPKALRKVMDPTMQAMQSGLARQFVADASGRVVFVPKSGATVPLRVSVYSAPKPVSSVRAPDSVRFAPGRDQAVLNLTGGGLDQGAGAERYRSLVSVFELQAKSPKLRDCGPDVVIECAVNETAKGGDLRYVGAASTAQHTKAAGKPDDSLLAFGVATWGDWANIGSTTQIFVDIDTNADGKPEFQTIVAKMPDTDVLVANTVSLTQPDNPSVDVQPVNGQFGDVDTNVFDTNVLVLPVRIAALGIDPNESSHRISYTAGSFGFYPAPGQDTAEIDRLSGWLSYDVLAPGYSVRGGGVPAITYVAKPGTALVVNRNQNSVVADKPLGLLVLEHHNAARDRARVTNLVAVGG
ncbi:S8 family serine peptidase [Lentzea sp. JNUCC 0626]|uniref:S8 family peptidase n=1 Tax=Lentzea sp. JNUCC 0626 TaxID=3367513 RepID=UPI00374965B1